MTADVSEFRVALTVDDFDGAVAFYRDTLGFGQLADWSSPQGQVILLDVGSATLELIDARQADYIDRVEAGRRVSGPVRLALGVVDADATAAGIVAGGGASVASGTVAPWGDRIVRVQAPDGMQLTLFSEA